MNGNMNAKKIMVIALLVLVTAVSITLIAPRAGDPESHRHSIQQTDDKIEKVIALSGGAAAASVTLSILPGDMGTPMANELAELAKYFLLILSALYLEKYLISLSGYITFSVLIPLACVLLGIAVVSGRRSHARTAARISVIGIVIFLIVPASVRLSDMVYSLQKSKVDETIEAYEDLDIEDDADGGLVNEITSITTDTFDKITSYADHLLESLAVMIVTACVIPLLVFVFMVWLVKVVFAGNTLTLDPAAMEALIQKRD